MSFLTQILRTKVRSIVEQSKCMDELDHLGTRGRWRELFLTELIEPLLPDGISATTGVLVDCKGVQSKQLDIIIYASNLLPPLFQSAEQSVIPVDAAIQVIEVKSTLNASEVKDSLRKARSVKGLFLQIAGTEYPPPYNALIANELKHPIRVPPIFTLFGFNSDLSGNGMTEWERYQKYVTLEKEMSTTGVYFNDICVAGSGYWNGPSTECISTDGNYSEVLHMLVTLSNCIPLWIKLRGTPQFGNYFSDLN